MELQIPPSPNNVTCLHSDGGRFIESGRYVPIGLIFDGYANDPLNTYFLLKDGIDLDIQPFDSFGLISTDVPKGNRPRILQASTSSPINELKK